MSGNPTFPLIDSEGSRVRCEAAPEVRRSPLSGPLVLVKRIANHCCRHHVRPRGEDENRAAVLAPASDPVTAALLDRDEHRLTDLARPERAV